MKTISLEDETFAELDKLTSPLFSHGDVVRKLLMSRSEVRPASLPVVAPVHAPENGSLTAYIQSADYQMLYSGINKYLAVLGWLYKTYPKDFLKVESYRLGKRVYFARSQKEVEEGGNGAIHAKQIPDSPVWTLATLSNQDKRKVLSDLLQLFGFT